MIEKLHTQDLVNWFVHNYDYVRLLLKPIKEKRNEVLNSADSLHLDDVEKQFKDRIKWILTSEVCLRTNIPTDSVLAFIEGININDLIKD